MVPEDLLFWIAPLVEAPIADASVLCLRHADAMVVPLGWTLDDRREDVLRLFRPRSAEAGPQQRAPRRSRARPAPVEQLQIDGTAEIERPALDASASEAVGDEAEDRGVPWEPEFDHDDDLDGLLAARGPLLARAFRGTDRPKR
jgi:hypothetical protein